MKWKNTHTQLFTMYDNVFFSFVLCYNVNITFAGVPTLSFYKFFQFSIELISMHLFILILSSLILLVSSKGEVIGHWRGRFFTQEHIAGFKHIQASAIIRVNTFQLSCSGLKFKRIVSFSNWAACMVRLISQDPINRPEYMYTEYMEYLSVWDHTFFAELILQMPGHLLSQRGQKSVQFAMSSICWEGWWQCCWKSIERKKER